MSEACSRRSFDRSYTSAVRPVACKNMRKSHLSCSLQGGPYGLYSICRSADGDFDPLSISYHVLVLGSQVTMMNLHLYLFEFIVLTLASATRPFVPLNTSRDVDTVATRPALETPDPRFKVELQFDGPKFPFISCVMSTVEFLAFLGSEDFSGSMEKVTRKLGRYREFGLVVAPSTVGGSIERRFVIWGLGLGVDYLINENHFQAANFTLLCRYSLQWFSF